MQTVRPMRGPRNLITDVEGLSVGQAHDPAVRSGVSVILADAPAVCACDVRGGAPGTRETDLLAPENLVEAYERDGVACVRGTFEPRWLEVLAAGVERNLAEPGPQQLRRAQEAV